MYADRIENWAALAEKVNPLELINIRADWHQLCLALADKHGVNRLVRFVQEEAVAVDRLLDLIGLGLVSNLTPRGWGLVGNGFEMLRDAIAADRAE